MRRRVGVTVLAVSVIYSLTDLLGWLRPMLLRMAAQPGARRSAAILLGSLTLKAVILVSGILLTFWPDRPARHHP